MQVPPDRKRVLQISEPACLLKPSISTELKKEWYEIFNYLDDFSGWNLCVQVCF